MESLRELYKAGLGPSSSHTMAPQRAVQLFMQRFPRTERASVELYGSLALTGRGHFTDVCIKRTFGDIPCTVTFMLTWEYPFPNGLIITNNLGNRWIVYSLGGGSIQVLNEDFDFQKEVYPERSMGEIYAKIIPSGGNLVDYALSYEPDLRIYIEHILDVMLQSVDHGLAGEGLLPGPLKVGRIAGKLHEKAQQEPNEDKRKKLLLYAYSYAVMEENASLGAVVTAPTCGSSGVMASLMYYYLHVEKTAREKLIDALIVGGVYGNMVKQNATISGAQGGCQAEVGVACAMASAAIVSLSSRSLRIIDYAAEIGIEHHLGLTCDPVGGFVIIPCIERNAVASQRAIDAAFMAQQVGEIRQNSITFDMVVQTMNYTGEKIVTELKETSLGGLASLFDIQDDDY